MRILLNEPTFSQMCKIGFIRYNLADGRKLEFPISSSDMRVLTSGKILTKTSDDTKVEIALQDIGLEMIREILMRSPVFSGMAYEI